jgi:hypothetical protein
MNSSLSNRGLSFSHSALLGGPYIGGRFFIWFAFIVSIVRNILPVLRVYKVKPADEPSTSTAMANCKPVIGLLLLLAEEEEVVVEDGDGAGGALVVGSVIVCSASIVRYADVWATIGVL